MKRSRSTHAQEEPGIRQKVYGFGMVFFLAFAAFWGLYQQRAPDVVPADAAPERFSSGRAMVHLRTIAAKPHPIGTPEHKEVREYLIGELLKLGLRVEVQKSDACRMPSEYRARVAHVENIITRIAGTDNSRAVMLAGHYDTVPNAPGATDDGSAVVTMLETARALCAGPPLKNDVIFLFTDGEEIGLLGAHAFAERHPWMEDVGVVLNFEGTGSSGPVLMFETSKNNSWLINEFSKAAPYPMANSLSYEIYKRMPNDTDLTIFKRKGYPGLNFAYVDDRYDYHTANDNLQNIDERSVQHHGSYALALARHFGGLDLQVPQDENAVYFNSVGYGLVVYSEKWITPLTIITVVLFLVVLFLGFRARKIKVWGVLCGLLAFAAHFVIAPVVILCFTELLEKWYTGPNWWKLYYNHRELLLAFVLLTVATLLFMYRLFLRGLSLRYVLIPIALVNGLLLASGQFQWLYLLISVAVGAMLWLVFRNGREAWDLTVGALALWVVVMVAVNFSIPGASYLATWPLLFALVAIILIFSGIVKDTTSFGKSSILALFSIPTLLWFSGLIYLFYLAMGVDSAWLAMIMVVMATGLLVPLLCQITAVHRWLLPGLLCALAALIIVFNTIGASFDERYRKPNTLFYAFDADEDVYFWGSTDGKTDEWTMQYLTHDPDTGRIAEIFLPYGGTILKAPAPAAQLSPPEITLLEDRVENGERRIALLIVTPRNAAELYMFLAPETPLIAATINAQDIKIYSNLEDEKRLPGLWVYYAPPQEGITVALTTVVDAPVTLKIADVSFGFPDFLNFSYRARPAYMMPSKALLSDQTVVTKTFSF